MSIFGPKYCSRPENAIHCGMWDRPSQEDKRSGMPSGHSWTAGCFLAVFVLSSKTGVTNRYGQALGLLLALLVALSRLSPRQVSSYISATPNGAHTLPQVIVGFCGGIVLERLLAPNDYDFFWNDWKFGQEGYRSLWINGKLYIPFANCLAVDGRVIDLLQPLVAFMIISMRCHKRRYD